MNRNRLKAKIKEHEGFRSKLYNDLTGKEHKSQEGKLTIGYGWNIEDNGLPEDIINLLLDRSIDIAEAACLHLFPNFSQIPDLQQEVLVNMAFNLGLNRLSKFVRMIECVKRSDFQGAAAEILDSAAARSPLKGLRDRYFELSQQMRGAHDV